MLLPFIVDWRREGRAGHSRIVDVGRFDAFEARAALDISLQERHPSGTLVIIVKVTLLFLEFFFRMNLATYNVQSDTRLKVGVSPDGLAAMLSHSMARSALSINARNCEVRNEHADSLGESSVCPVVEVNADWIR